MEIILFFHKTFKGDPYGVGFLYLENEKVDQISQKRKKHLPQKEISA